MHRFVCLSISIIFVSVSTDLEPDTVRRRLPLRRLPSCCSSSGSSPARQAAAATWHGTTWAASGLRRESFSPVPSPSPASRPLPSSRDTRLTRSASRISALGAWGTTHRCTFRALHFRLHLTLYRGITVRNVTQPTHQTRPATGNRPDTEPAASESRPPDPDRVSMYSST